MARQRKDGMYRQVIERLFFAGYKRGIREVTFDRAEIATTAEKLGLDVAKNLGDLVYSFKFRTNLPTRIVQTASEGEEWRIESAGRAKYRFVLGAAFRIEPDVTLAETKIPDSTPGIIARYALTDEQALLAKLRYNRLLDIFTGVTCYSLQSHLRTSVKLLPNASSTQVETDELYVGIERHGAQYVFPVQAKGGRDKIAIQQLEQDVLLCEQKFPTLVCKAIAAQFMQNDQIALFAFEPTEDGLRKTSECHYRLVPKDDISEGDLVAYRDRLKSR